MVGLIVNNDISYMIGAKFDRVLFTERKYRCKKIFLYHKYEVLFFSKHSDTILIMDILFDD